MKREFHLREDSLTELIQTSKGKGRLPLLTGRRFHQFEITDEETQYWIDEKAGRLALIGGDKDDGRPLDYQGYRWVYRRIARNTDTRTFITTIAPRNVFTEVNSPTLDVAASKISPSEMVGLCALTNSFVLEWFLRRKVTTTLNNFYIEQLPIPRLTAADPAFRPLVERAARLVGTTAEFDDLLKEIFGPRATHHTHGERTPEGRARIRAEIDAQVARLYALTEPEFTHILSTFPLVSEAVRTAAFTAFRTA